MVVREVDYRLAAWGVVGYGDAQFLKLGFLPVKQFGASFLVGIGEAEALIVGCGSRPPVRE